ncbi:putative apyrase [Dirofilaria immitis]
MVHQDPQFRYIDICVKAERAELKSKEDDGHRSNKQNVFLNIIWFNEQRKCYPHYALIAAKGEILKLLTTWEKNELETINQCIVDEEQYEQYEN